MSARKKEAVRSDRATDLTTPEAVERFREAAEDFTKQAVISKESALKALADSGIYTKSGKLAKNYRS